MARLAKIFTALLLAPCDAGNLSSITWLTQGDVNATMTAQEVSFVSTKADQTNSNYAYSEYANVVKFTVKPNYADSSLADAKVGFVCGSSFTDSLVSTDSFAFVTHPNPRTMFYNKGSPVDVNAVVAIPDGAEMEFEIDNSTVNIKVCTDSSHTQCVQDSFPMGGLSNPSCRAKMTMSSSGAGFEVLEAVTLDATSTVTSTETVTVTTTVATTSTLTNTTTTITTTTVTAAGVASAALPVSINWMGAVPMAMATAAAALSV